MNEEGASTVWQRRGAGPAAAAMAVMGSRGDLWRAVAGAALTAGMIVGVLSRSGDLNYAAILADVPRDYSFWLALAALMIVSPSTDWLILRKLWRLPPAGFLPLLHKQAANEVVLGYSGDAQFYLWARRNVASDAAPFATLRDMSILSALAGNLATLCLMALTYPALRGFIGGPLGTVAVAATAVIICSSIAILLLQRVLFSFSLSKTAIATVLGAFIARTAAALLITAWLWSLVAPGITPATLMVLATVRMMLSRVPLLPAKEAIFAGVALTLAGRAAPLTHAIVAVSTLMLTVNLAVCAVAFLTFGAILGTHFAVQTKTA